MTKTRISDSKAFAPTKTHTYKPMPTVNENLTTSQTFYESKEVFRTLVTKAPVGIFQTDKEGNCIFVNDRWCKIAGMKPKEAQGQGWVQALHPDDKERIFKEWYEAAKMGKEFLSEYRFQTKKGVITWLHGSAIALHDKKGKPTGYLGTIVDITAKKEAEKRLEDTSNLLATIVETAPIGFCLFDKNLKYIMINKRLADLNGISPKDHIGKSIQEIVPSVKEVATKQLRSVLKTGKPIIGIELSGETKREPGIVKHWVEDYFPVRSVTGELIAIGALVVEITEQKKAREKLLKSKEQYKRLIDVSLSPMVVHAAGEIMYANQAAVKLIGANDQDEFIGKNVQQFIHPDYKNIVKERIDEIYQKKKQFTDIIEEKFIKLDGEIIDVEVASLAVEYEGKPAIQVIIRDITEQKKLDGQKDEFIGIASHELKTPVTSLKAFGQVIQKKLAKSGDESSVILLGKMDAQINKLTKLIEDLLDISKIQGGKLQFHEEYFAFDELVNELIEEIQRTTEKHHIIKKGKTGKILYSDRDRTGQVITNFLTNALKYSPKSNNIIVKSFANKQKIQLCVQDFGVGIPRNNLPFVFERFYRVKGKTHDTVPGMGLGLYISSEIIKRQGGKIWATSERGKGATFCFSLPILDGKKVQSSRRKVFK